MKSNGKIIFFALIPVAVFVVACVFWGAESFKAQEYTCTIGAEKIKGSVSGGVKMIGGAFSFADADTGEKVVFSGDCYFRDYGDPHPVIARPL